MNPEALNPEVLEHALAQAKKRGAEPTTAYVHENLDCPALREVAARNGIRIVTVLDVPPARIYFAGDGLLDSAGEDA